MITRNMMPNKQGSVVLRGVIYFLEALVVVAFAIK